MSVSLIHVFVILLLLMNFDRIIQSVRQVSFFYILRMSWCCENIGLHAIRKVRKVAISGRSQNQDLMYLQKM